ncbi:hypothetical protein DHD32_10200 [Arenibacter sp. TNZ]|uniref:hypothetical protein n=1 Tax=Arenibacter TaxID=178469 RepID=UPI000CD3D7C8|nr:MULTISPECIES: hypothetical protein [Arenibacter]MCM4171853.1 hypothetical protein [Arenibacter sp. TNZ]
MQVSIKGYITSKKSELFYDCADRFSYDKSQNKFAISDGVSKSFFPKIWADVLVNKWVGEIWNTDEEFIKECQKDWLQQVTEIVYKPDAKWFTTNAFNRKESGLATFVGLCFYKKKKDWFWKANALGDSFLFFVPEKVRNFSKQCIVLSSKKEPIIFDNFPDYLSSIGNIHKGKKRFKENPLNPGTFYLMTDALAEWFLNEKENAIGKISVWQNQKDFERFVDEERLNEKLGNDDSAILIIQIVDDKKENLNYVSEDVSNINILIEVQQKVIEAAEIAKKEELDLKEENSNSETIVEEKNQEGIIENQPADELEKPKDGLFTRILGKKESKQPIKTEEPPIDEKEEVTEENQKEKESLSQDGENNSELKKPESNQIQESEPNRNENSESKEIILNKSSQNITDKF